MGIQLIDLSQDQVEAVVHCVTWLLAATAVGLA